MHHLFRAACAVLVAAGCVTAAPARAAESFDNCKGFIDSLPATIATQGVWCLRKDLATAMTSGAAITVATNNVTIDCNGYRVGGLAGGPMTNAIGIYTGLGNNTTVRGCNVRGFAVGIDLRGSSLLVEDNRLDANTQAGIELSTDGDGTGSVRRNLIRDTGGRPGHGYACGIEVSNLMRVIDNDVQGVFPLADADGNATACGISAGSQSFVLRNRISGLIPSGTGYAFGISGMFTLVAENVATVVPGTRGRAFVFQKLCEKNVAKGFALPSLTCTSASNTFQP